MARTKDAGGSAVERLRAFGLEYPGAHTKSPWPGHLDLAVNDKTFAYLSLAGDPLTISCKLPHSADSALALPFATPTAYGLGKSGWVTANFPDDQAVPVELLEEWIDESYRAQAPKRLSARLPAPGQRLEVEATPARQQRSGPVTSTPAVLPRSTVKQAAAAPSTEAPARASKRRAAPAAKKTKRAGQRPVRSTKRAGSSSKKRSVRSTKRAGASTTKQSSAATEQPSRRPKKRRRAPNA